MKPAPAKLSLAIAVFLFILKVPGCLNAQNALTAEQIDRLYRIGQLWGHITYFHPYLQYKKIPFDSAYAAAVPGILAAKTDAELVGVLNAWLGILNDPITRIEITPQKVSSKVEVDFQDIKGIGLLTLSGSENDWALMLEKINAIKGTVEKATAIVVDLRQLQGDTGWILSETGIENSFFSGSLTTLGHRTVSYNGFVPEMGTTSGNYVTYFKDFPPKTLTGNLDKDRPTVFILSSGTTVPEVVWAMRKAGKAFVISDGVASNLNNAYSYPLTEKLTAFFRGSDPISGNTDVDLVIGNNNKSVLLEKAFDIIRKNDFAPKEEVPQFAVKMIEKTHKYGAAKFPDIGYRALAAAKMHSVINYFFPNKKLMKVNWDSVARVYLPLIVGAKDSAEYQLAMHAFYAHIQDGHGSVRGTLIPEIVNGGRENAPVTGRIVEGKYVVTKIISDSLAKVCNIEIGDVILKRNGIDVPDIINKLRQYRAASNEVIGARYASRWICSGTDGVEGLFTIQKKNGKIINVKLPFSKELTKMFSKNPSERSNDNILRFLAPDIGYADLDRLETVQVDSMFNMFKNTKAIVFDMRGYPNGTTWAISPRLTNKKNVPSSKFTRLDRDLPMIGPDDSGVGEWEVWTSFISYIPQYDPTKEVYKGKTVMLINESTQSQAEGTGLNFYAANGTKFIGSQTAGANGDVTNFIIPGGLTFYFSGQTVWYLSGKQMQGIGIIPDVPVRPTIKGIQAGRDEVLEAAIRYLQKN